MYHIVYPRYFHTGATELFLGFGSLWLFSVKLSLTRNYLYIVYKLCNVAQKICKGYLKIELWVYYYDWFLHHVFQTYQTAFYICFVKGIVVPDTRQKGLQIWLKYKYMNTFNQRNWKQNHPWCSQASTNPEEPLISPKNPKYILITLGLLTFRLSTVVS